MPVDVSTHEGEDGPLELVHLAEQLLVLVDRPEHELSILLCDDPTIRELNRTWRATDAATDVLSFPQGEAPQAGPVVLGDVVISLDTAARQAAERGHATEVERSVLLVHGLLHLLGHDHHEPDERATMEAEEMRLLTAIGLQAAGLVGRSG